MAAVQSRERSHKHATLLRRAAQMQTVICGWSLAITYESASEGYGQCSTSTHIVILTKRRGTCVELLIS